MPRQSRSRPTARSSSSSSASTSPFSSNAGQTRSASTAAYPHATPPTAQVYSAQQQERQPGMLAQMAATAGSVAVGSTIGHGLSHMLFGGRSEAPPPVEQAAPVQQQQYQPGNSGISCEYQAREFAKCMDQGDMNSCSWLLDQLKACQEASRRY
ncbi:hypothetical protein CTheo_1810 [Ceratobasidium theobromae]|uniref:Uncharacterized protein n=1 Tax=Ceratobasidium theobromae TaxID=1582974 RepID=A0A5N5QSY2_9AGAM|nr:hypothetical protein CTheo_1810 [Ceratobasidium theobromae]